MTRFTICSAHKIYFGEIKSRRMRWMGLVSHMAENRNIYRILVGKPEGKTPLVKT